MKKIKDYRMPKLVNLRLFCFYCAGVLVSLPGYLRADDVFELSEQIIKAQEKLAAVWPGYWKESQAFAVYDDEGKVLLITNGDKPSGFSPLNDQAYIYQATVEHFKYAGAYEVRYDFGDVAAPAIKQEDDSFSAQTLFHEAFHGYQRESFIDNDVVFAPLEEVTSELFTLKLIENFILNNAISATDTAKRQNMTGIYSALRKRRQEKESTVLTGSQLYSEREEGVANYVGIAAFATLKSKDERWIVSEISRYLAPQERVSTFHDTYTGKDSYGVGAAITYLLLKDNPELYKEITQSKSPFELLAEIYPATFTDELYEEFLSRQGYKRLEKKMTKAFKRSQKIFEKFENKKDYLLTIEFNSDNLGAFSADNVIPVAKKVHLVQKPSEVSFVGPKVKGSFSKYWYMMNSLEGGRHRLDIALPEKPELTCIEDKTTCKLEMSNMELKLKGTTQVEELDNVMNIIIR